MTLKRDLWPVTVSQVAPSPVVPLPRVIVSFGLSKLRVGQMWLLGSVAQASSDNLFTDPVMRIISAALHSAMGPVWLLEVGPCEPGSEAEAIIAAARLNPSIRLDQLVIFDENIWREVILRWERHE